MIEMKDVSKKFTVKKKKRKMFGRSSNVDKVVISNINLTISKGSIKGKLMTKVIKITNRNMG